MMVNAELTTGQNAENRWLKRPQQQTRHLHHIPSSRLMDHREEDAGRLYEPGVEKEWSTVMASLLCSRSAVAAYTRSSQSPATS